MKKATQTALTQLLAELARTNDFSGVVRVLETTGAATEASFGFSNRALEVNNQTTTSFAIASGTKFLTALALGKLIDGGAATLGTRFVDIVPNAPKGISAEVTLDHLLTHTSGVYDYYDEELIDDFDNFVMPIPGTELETVADYLPMLDGEMKFAPGERFSYSNGGYVLLGLAIEALSGASFQRYVQSTIFAPVGMNGSGFFRLDALPLTAAIGYVDGDNRAETNELKLPVIGGPDGGSFTTAADIERLWLAFVDNQVLSTALTDRYISPTNHYKDSIHDGCGVWIDKSEPSSLYIEGADAGVSFMSRRFADGTISTVISNTSEGAWSVAKSINAALSGV